jgi:DinB superfamily
MSEAVGHIERIADLLERVDQASSRLATRIEEAGARATLATIGWSPAQIGAHVAMVNREFAALIDGSAPHAAPAPDGFVERSWPEITKGIPERVEAPSRVAPPAEISSHEAAALVRESATRLRTAIAGLSPDRARYCVTSRVVGTITLYQVGDWAVGHMIRHNQQAKRILGQ